MSNLERDTVEIIRSRTLSVPEYRWLEKIQGQRLRHHHLWMFQSNAQNSAFHHILTTGIYWLWVAAVPVHRLCRRTTFCGLITSTPCDLVEKHREVRSLLLFTEEIRKFLVRFPVSIFSSIFTTMLVALLYLYLLSLIESDNIYFLLFHNQKHPKLKKAILVVVWVYLFDDEKKIIFESFFFRKMSKVYSCRCKLRGTLLKPFGIFTKWLESWFISFQADQQNAEKEPEVLTVGGDEVHVDEGVVK